MAPKGLLSFLQIEEDDARRIADGRVMAGEVKAACVVIDTENGDVVAPLVAAIEKPASGIEAETARIVPACPLVRDKGQLAGGVDGKDANAVMQPVADVDKPAIGGNQDLGAEVAAGKTRGQAGDRLPRGQPADCRVVVEQDDVRAFLLK